MESTNLINAIGLRLRFIPQIIALTWKESPRAVVTMVGGSTLSAFIPLAIAIIGKELIDHIVALSGADVYNISDSADSSYRYVYYLLGIEATLIVFLFCIERVTATIRQSISLRLAASINLMIISKTLRLSLLQLENSEFHDKLVRARREASSRPLSLLNDTLHCIRHFVSLTIFALALLSFHSIAPIILLIASLPGFFYELSYAKKLYQIRRENAVAVRRQNYIEHLFSDARHFKEIMLFRLKDLLVSQYKERATTIYSQENRLLWKQTSSSSFFHLVTTIALYFVILHIINESISGTITIGTMLLFVTSAKSCQNSFQSLLSSLGSAHSNSLYISNLYEFLDSPEDGHHSVTPKPPPIFPPVLPPPRQTMDGVVVDNLSFRYSPASPWCIHNVSFHVPNGQRVAILGVNGSGKSTLAKIISGIYRSENGEVLLTTKGVTTRIREPRAEIVMLTQDFAKFQMTLHDNVKFGFVERESNDNDILSALKQTGFDLSSSHRKHELETQLGHLFPNGTELSGGEWQRIALARTLFNIKARVYIFDEPTAALDPASEVEFVNQVLSMPRESIVLVITHRLQIAKRMDRILVLERGTISQDGDHFSLSTSEGVYRNLNKTDLRGRPM